MNVLSCVVINKCMDIYIVMVFTFPAINQYSDSGKILLSLYLEKSHLILAKKY